MVRAAEQLSTTTVSLVKIQGEVNIPITRSSIMVSEAGSSSAMRR